jgi:hypothetical protein
MTTSNDQFVTIFSVLTRELDGVTASVADIATLVENGLVSYVDDYGRLVPLSVKSTDIVNKCLNSLSSLFRLSQSRVPPDSQDLATIDDVAHSLAFNPDEFSVLQRFGWQPDQLPDFSVTGEPNLVLGHKQPGNKRVKSQNTLICALASMAGLSLKDASADYELIAKHLRLTSPSVVDLPQKRTISVVLDEAYAELN